MYGINDFMTELELLTKAKDTMRTVNELSTSISKTLTHASRKTRTEICEDLIEANILINNVTENLKILLKDHYKANKDEINNGYEHL